MASIFKSISLKVVGILILLFSGHQSFAEQNTGDTIGSAMTLISSINRSADYTIHPEQTIGESAAKNQQRLIKHMCSELGTQIGYAFAINTVLRLYTPEYMSGSDKKPAVPLKINEIIDGLTNARNKNCSGPIDGSNAIKAIKEASAAGAKSADELGLLLVPKKGTTGSKIPEATGKQ